jgi:hypothetical protein
MCHTVSALLGRRIGRLHDPEVVTASPTSFESVTMALSASGGAIVLTVERGSTRIETRTSP